MYIRVCYEKKSESGFSQIYAEFTAVVISANVRPFVKDPLIHTPIYNLYLAYKTFMDTLVIYLATKNCNV